MWPIAFWLLVFQGSTCEIGHFLQPFTGKCDVQCPDGYQENAKTSHCDGEFCLLRTTAFQEPQLHMKAEGPLPPTGLMVDPEDSRVILDPTILLPASFTISMTLRLLDVQKNDKLLQIGDWILYLEDYDEILFQNEYDQEEVKTKLQSSLNMDTWQLITISYQYGRHSANSIRIWNGDELMAEMYTEWEYKKLSWDTILACSAESPCAEMILWQMSVYNYAVLAPQNDLDLHAVSQILDYISIEDAISLKGGGGRGGGGRGRFGGGARGVRWSAGRSGTPKPYGTKTYSPSYSKSKYTSSYKSTYQVRQYGAGDWRYYGGMPHTTIIYANPYNSGMSVGTIIYLIILGVVVVFVIIIWIYLKPVL